MKLVPGTLYFISEVDVLTGQKFDYYKIGLVKDSRQGDAFDRAGEHQTGNPRRLEVRHTVESPAINDLETLMHDLYATERVFGEWFVLPGNHLKKAISRAQKIVEQQEELLEAASNVVQYAKVASTETVLPATQETSALFLDLHQARFEQKEIKKVLAAEKEFFANLSGSKFNTSSYFTTTPKVLTQFKEDEFALKYPDIYEEFVEVTTEVSGNFLPSKPVGLALTLPKRIIRSLAEQSLRLEKAGNRPRETTVQEIHFHHLEILGLAGACRWRDDQYSTHLKSLIEGDSGIEGIATWNRKAKTTSKFATAEFRKAYPDLAAEFTTKTETTSSATVDMRSYIWSPQ